LIAAKNITVVGLEAPLELRRHPTARRLTLRVCHTKRAVIVTLPAYSSLAEAGRFLNEHMDWIKERLDALPKPVPFEDGAVIPYRGESHLIRFLGPTRHKRVAWIEGARAAAEARREVEAVASEAGRRPRPLPRNQLPIINVTGEWEHAPRRLHDWLVEQARRQLSARVAVHAERLNLRPRRVTVRDQSSRWGSCSSSRILSFSWRLILAPPFVLDYVAAHEVAHLKEMNHGPRYWALVKKTYPRLEEARRWLHRHGAELHGYGTETD
jgi:predicted metal-dependent hydrolase